jgi:hypothetical protein
MNQPASRAFTTKYPGRVDRIITPIQICAAFDPADPPDPIPKYNKTKALWDTGATSCVITKNIASSLGLIPVGKTVVTHAGGKSEAPTYLVNFILPNEVRVLGAFVSECPEIVFDVGVIIGMDIISMGDFSITNVGGRTWVSYRYPSIGRIDYVKDADEMTFKGVSKNSPCPCGRTRPSGKPIPFKNCHGRQFRK